MLYEISSGNGPSECELAVTKMVNYLTREYKVTLMETSSGYNSGTYRSATISTTEDLTEFIGYILWVCKSPFRPNHGRKNWYIDFKAVGNTNEIKFDPSKVIYTTMHSGGNGGQNVNKVETGVRAVYPPTGDVTVCTDERSQLANKKKAMIRLEKLVLERNTSNITKQANEMRISHTNLERGNAVAKFEGDKFKRIR